MDDPEMSLEARRQLTVLDVVERDQHITQRSLSAKLGIALGLTNVYLKRLIRKGYITRVNVESNRWRYLITPQGQAEKSRLTYELMDYSLRLYRDVRQHLSEVTEPTLRTAGIREVEFGSGVTVIEPVNLYGCKIGDGAFIGPFVEIQRGVAIGQRTRIQSHSFICELVSIGNDCFVAHGVMFINDTFAAGEPAGDRSGWKATRIGDRVSIGSNATILPVSICDGVVIGAGAVVTADITESGVYAGNPARKLRSRR